MITPVPPHVEHWRKARCNIALCDAAPDFADACARCPNGHWGVFMFCPTATADPVGPLSRSAGPGTKLAAMLKRLGFKVCAGCGSMAQRMNREGAGWCREHVEEILAEMRKNAESPETNPLRIPFVEWAARRMVLRACRE